MPIHQQAARHPTRSSDAMRPAELVDDRRKEQRKGGAGVDAEGHRDEGHGYDHPAVEER
jgi:hypothetical protein